MRVAVLPREVAASVITAALSRGAWAVNAASLVITIPILIEFLAEHGLIAALPVPLSILLLLLGLTCTAWYRPRPWIVAGYLVVAAAATVFYEIALIAADPDIAGDGLFLLNRPTVSLVLVGVAATTALSGILWSGIGLLASFLVAIIVGAVVHAPLAIGWGPSYFFVIYTAAYLVLRGIQASQRRKVPNFDELEQETRRLAVEENLRSRVASAVHDTLLNDLSMVMNAPDELDERMTSRLRADIATLTSAEWLHESAAVTVTDDQDSELRNQVMLMISDLQWRGLTVRVTGSGPGIYRLAPATAPALIDAVRACLENVLRHAQATVAEVDLAYTEREIAIMVSDDGVGFDPDAVADDRLGLRESVVGRIRAVGGSTRIWSAPGEGTSVLMRVPVLEMVQPHDKSEHERPLTKGVHGGEK
ncbi:sensor histidine kinase [soil metagenome]